MNLLLMVLYFLINPSVHITAEINKIFTTAKCFFLIHLRELLIMRNQHVAGIKSVLFTGQLMEKYPGKMIQICIIRSIQLDLILFSLAST